MVKKEKLEIEGDLIWGSEHTIQYADAVLQHCTPETCIILLTSVTAIHSIKMFRWPNLNTILHMYSVFKNIYGISESFIKLAF